MEVVFLGEANDVNGLYSRFDTAVVILRVFRRFLHSSEDPMEETLKLDKELEDGGDSERFTRIPEITWLESSSSMACDEKEATRRD